MNGEQINALNGPRDGSSDMHKRVLHDLCATLGTVINLYGDMYRPPTMRLTWPPNDMVKIKAPLKAMEKQVWVANDAKDNKAYYKAIALSFGYYKDALRATRAMARNCDHQELEGYARRAHDYARRVHDPVLYEDAVTGRPEALQKAVMSACKQTRERFAKQLRRHAVDFDPPTVAPDFVYRGGIGNES